MWGWLKSLFRAPVVIKYQVVELEREQRLEPETEEDVQSVLTLAYHPGFIRLQKKLAVVRAQLKSKLANEFHKDMNDVHWLQAGIVWSSWLDEELKRATTRSSQKKVTDPLEEELKAFQAIDAQIERVGMDEQ